MVHKYFYRKNRKKLFKLALDEGEITSEDVAELLNTTEKASSMLLMTLHREKWLNRHKEEDENRPRGQFARYVYSPSKLLYELYETYPTH